MRWENSTGYSLLVQRHRMMCSFDPSWTREQAMYRQMRSRRPSSQAILIRQPESGIIEIFLVRHIVVSTREATFSLFRNFACEFVHFALGSSAGTENDTWVSARIKIFMMMRRTNLMTKTKGRQILLVTIMMTVITQKYAANGCTTVPLNYFTALFVSRWKVFSTLFCVYVTLARLAH